MHGLYRVAVTQTMARNHQTDPPPPGSCRLRKRTKAMHWRVNQPLRTSSQLLTFSSTLAFSEGTPAAGKAMNFQRGLLLTR